MNGNKQEEKIRSVYDRLVKSGFRNSFHLKTEDILYIKKHGIYRIQEHAFDFIRRRLAHSYVLNDGRQTPMRGHPVFIAQHATRDCLYKWPHIEQNRGLSEHEINYIVSFIMYWIIRD